MTFLLYFIKQKILIKVWLDILVELDSSGKYLSWGWNNKGADIGSQKNQNYQTAEWQNWHDSDFNQLI